MSTRTHGHTTAEWFVAVTWPPRSAFDLSQTPVPLEPVPLQAGSSPHVLATVGMLALALLSGGLLLRNRLATERTLSPNPEPPREEFTTDREKVCELVRENGGRMKQSEIVDSVEWSKAKVSRLLADLEEDERVTKLRLGRENLICLPGHEPTASKSTDSTSAD